MNNFRVFYCSPMIIEPDEVKAQYEKCLDQENSESTQEGPDVNQEDFEFGFGNL